MSSPLAAAEAAAAAAEALRRSSLPHEAVRDAIWQNLSVTPWLESDILVIDNHAVGHGRLPYRGRRNIAVAWA